MRLEKDLLGELEVPEEVYWGINTQRTLNNFKISQRRFPKVFLYALALVKRACLSANQKSEVIDEEIGKAVFQTIDEMLNEGKFFDQFPIDVFQTGSGTQINMNMNEVLANRANEILGHPKGKKHPVHPNDHINRSQSSNDVIPTAMHLASVNLIQYNLIPSLELLEKTLKQKIKEFKGIVKVGRTHLQDAVPIPLSTEFAVYLRQIGTTKNRLKEALNELYLLPIGGTALGTGLNAPKNFDQLVIEELIQFTGFNYKINPVKAEGISSHNTIVKTSSVLKLLALSLMKMANDIRWMGSGPRAGLGELLLPENEPGSSIMPGKINPTQSEAIIQVCLQVIGNDTVISYAESSGSILDLNVTKPIMIVNLLESINILSTSIESFVLLCLKGLKANIANINEALSRSLMLVTRLTPIIGYEKAGEIAKKAYETGKTIKEIIQEMDLDIEEDLDELLDPRKMV
ncbi:MAG: class II fumarate hydratase [Candidatus Heimdallarchaeota archaeon]|nr:class II fumarate hydratase [Candidatus Heimdallarchaeota archaeon]MBY8993527.1 class II fumarate hydratase [Candidatus Heimdallarchaeota archaeon]